MFVACWSVKGGSGTTVVSAALALSIAATGRDALLVDLAGDLPAALGIPEPDGPGLADWLGAGPGVPPDALSRLEVDAGPSLALLATGGVLPDAPKRAEELAATLAVDGRAVIADCGVVADRVSGLVREEAPLLTSEAHASAVGAVVADVAGLGTLEPLLADDDVTEVMINGPGPVWVERVGHLERTDVVLNTPAIEHLIEK